jgi:gas vesicle protein
MNNRTIPVLAFFTGIAVGAVVALLYAPSSGSELRTQIRQETNAAVTRTSNELTRAIESIEESMEELQQEIRSRIPSRAAAQPPQTPQA